MTDSHIALSVVLGEDLLPLSVLLSKRGVDHRIYEEDGKQVLCVVDATYIKEVVELYRAWRADELTIEIAQRAPRRRASSNLVWQRTPVTLMLLILSVLGFVLATFNTSGWALSWLTFTPFTALGQNIVFMPQGHEYWRIITPAFLHFGWLHIVFNSLWLWELGRRIETVTGRINMLGLFVVIAAISNCAQFIFGGPGIFGGMSGVVYGLLGFAWMGAQIQPRWAFQPQPAIMLFMIGWLVICIFGVVEVLGFGAVANAAHVGGLLAGVVLGAVFGLLSRAGLSSDRTPSARL
ncbi:MAG: rhomboid family intramembrane serine protease [Parahaliea sp.]